MISTFLCEGYQECCDRCKRRWDCTTFTWDPVGQEPGYGVCDIKYHDDGFTRKRGAVSGKVISDPPRKMWRSHLGEPRPKAPPPPPRPPTPPGTKPTSSLECHGLNVAEVAFIVIAESAHSEKTKAITTTQISTLALFVSPISACACDAGCAKFLDAAYSVRLCFRNRRWSAPGI